jgi:two-component system, chemotaxis family, protein-glutamate methylesterase/glutaminase
MSTRNIVVIGGSAGGLEALLKLAGALPGNLAASLFVVIHTSTSAEGLLAQIVRRAGSLPAFAVDGREAIRQQRIYLASVDHHLLIERGHVKVTGGPKENGFRPAVDPLFRTAAAAYGSRVIGVVLSGGLDDGTRGLLAIKRAGGLAVVQEPVEALVPGMPRSAIDNVSVDHVAAAADIGPLLVRLVREEVTEIRSMARKKKCDVAEQATRALKTGELSGPPSSYVCPECGGSLWELRDEKLLSFRCHVGHAYTADGLVARHTEKLDAALWTALRTLEDSAALRRHMADNMRDRGIGETADKYDDQAAQLEERADVIRDVVSLAEPALPTGERAERGDSSFKERGNEGGNGNGRREYL